ncbi:hypothetical protein D3248_04545 [Leucobacter zeae]|nr:hypothetical protein [Leucobacter zeae]
MQRTRLISRDRYSFLFDTKKLEKSESCDRARHAEVELAQDRAFSSLFSVVPEALPPTESGIELRDQREARIPANAIDGLGLVLHDPEALPLGRAQQTEGVLAHAQCTLEIRLAASWVVQLEGIAAPGEEHVECRVRSFGFHCEEAGKLFCEPIATGLM